MDTLLIREKAFIRRKNSQIEDCLSVRFSKEERQIHLKIHRAYMLNGYL